MRPPDQSGVPAGLTVSDDGHALYIAETWGQRVEKVAVSDGRAVWVRQLGAAAGAAGTDPEDSRVEASADPDAPFPYTCVADERHGRIFVSLWAKSTVLVLDAKTGTELARWPVAHIPMKWFSPTTAASSWLRLT